MSFALEHSKLKRTGLLPTLLLGGFLSASFPIINLLIRKDSFINLPKQPLQILVASNWMLITMLNSFLMILSACIIYHIEFTDNAIQRMDSLPIRPSSLFLGKFALLAASFIAILTIEGGALLLCTWKWFSITDGFLTELIKFIAYSFLLSLPVLSIMLAVSSFCKNMWTTIGIGVIGVFASQILNNIDALKYFPFLMPYKSSSAGIIVFDKTLCIVAASETILFIIVGIVLSKVRRNS